MLAGIFSSDAMVRIIGAFCVRVPVSWFMSRRAGATLFDIGLATPFSSILQLVLCLGCMLVSEKEKMGIGYRVNVFRNVVCPSAKNCAKMSKEDFVREGYD